MVRLIVEIYIYIKIDKYISATLATLAAANKRDESQVIPNRLIPCPPGSATFVIVYLFVVRFVYW